MKTTKAFILFLFVLLISCGESRYNNNIPYKEVSFLVYPLIDFDKTLTSPGGIAITESCNHNGGQSCGYANQGIIVCRMIMSDSYAAYACTCPDDLTKLEIVKDAILKVKCPKCGRVFELDNRGISGKYRLVQYRIQMSESMQFFRVYN